MGTRSSVAGMGGAAVSGDEEEAEGTGRGQQGGEMAALRGGRLGEGIGREARVCVWVCGARRGTRKGREVAREMWIEQGG